VPFYLDGLIPDWTDAGVAPMLGHCHLRTLTILGLPDSTWPGCSMSSPPGARLSLVVRWLRSRKPRRARDYPQAPPLVGQAARHRRVLREDLVGRKHPAGRQRRREPGARRDEALQELGSDAVSFGYFTATITAVGYGRDRDPEAVKAIVPYGALPGLRDRRGDAECRRAWLSSRRANAMPMSVTAGLVAEPGHMLPLSRCGRAGAQRPLDGRPLLVARTAGSTPFRMVLHQGDVGHCLILAADRRRQVGVAGR